MLSARVQCVLLREGNGWTRGGNPLFPREGNLAIRSIQSFAVCRKCGLRHSILGSLRRRLAAAVGQHRLSVFYRRHHRRPGPLERAHRHLRQSTVLRFRDFLRRRDYRRAGYAPGYLYVPPVLDADTIHIPFEFAELRQTAWDSGYFWGDNHALTYRISLRGSFAKVWQYPTGTLFDSMTNPSEILVINYPACWFFERPVELSGHLWGQLTIGSSYDVHLVDNVWYNCATLRRHGYVLPGGFGGSCYDIMGIVSEGDIKVGNTFANGRNNSNGRGLQQTDPDSTDIVIMATLWAAGKITFENQNDVDSGYACDCVPDLRGKVYLLGSMIQPHFTPFRRSTNDTTGYLLKLQYDTRLRLIQPPGLPSLPEELPVSPQRPPATAVPSQIRMDIYPNPFNASTTVRYELPHGAHITLSVLDLLGRTTMSLDLGEVAGGEHAQQLDGSNLPSGVYFVRLQATGQTMTRKMLLLK